MSDRFADLVKIPADPARRLLALANAKVKAPLASPANASVSAVLEELDAQDATLDMLRLLSAALPARECIWWGCLAAGDLLEDGAPATPALKAARAWVFKPTDENRDAARQALEVVEPDDNTTLIATAVAMCDGKLGTGELSEIEAAPGVAATTVFALNVMSMGHAPAEDMDAQVQVLIDRALDIARGGNGQNIVRKVREPAP